MRPTEIKLHRKSAVLELVYADGASVSLPAEFLRVFSPSAEVRGHGQGQAALQAGKRQVQFKDLQPQGNYALRIAFSDGHDSGIYTWEYLLHLGQRQEALWQEYLRQLKAAGQSRDPRFIAVSCPPTG